MGPFSDTSRGLGGRGILGCFLLIPDYDPDEPEEVYPGGIQPGEYTRNQVVDMLRKHAENPEAIRFIADMLEE